MTTSGEEISNWEASIIGHRMNLDSVEETRSDSFVKSTKGPFLKVRGEMALRAITKATKIADMHLELPVDRHTKADMLNLI